MSDKPDESGLKPGEKLVMVNGKPAIVRGTAMRPAKGSGPRDPNYQVPESAIKSQEQFADDMGLI